MSMFEHSLTDLERFAFIFFHSSDTLVLGIDVCANSRFHHSICTGWWLQEKRLRYQVLNPGRLPLLQLVVSRQTLLKPKPSTGPEAVYYCYLHSCGLTHGRGMFSSNQYWNLPWYSKQHRANSFSVSL